MDKRRNVYASIKYVFCRRLHTKTCLLIEFNIDFTTYYINKMQRKETTTKKFYLHTA